MRPSPLPLLLALAGCVSAPFAPAQTCVLHDGAVVHLSAQQDCAGIQAVSDASRDALVGAGILERRAYEDLERATVFWVHSDESREFTCRTTPHRSGCQYWAEGEAWVELTRDGASWAHEMLHVVDQRVLHTPEALSWSHVGWSTRGASGGRISTPDGTYLEGSWTDIALRAYFLQYFRDHP